MVMSEDMAYKIINEVHLCSDKERAIAVARFFKTGHGQYGEGDVFWGLRVPQIREVAKSNTGCGLGEIESLLEHEVHEIRLCALLILVEQFKKSGEEERSAIITLYLKRTDRINNWDLVDLSVSILGTYLLNKDRNILYQLSKSINMWEQRISIVTCLTFVRNNDFIDALAISKYLLQHKHDLIHKAVGWVLRELGKRDRAALTNFLLENKSNMARTTLRYAIEHYSKEERQKWLQK